MKEEKLDKLTIFGIACLIFVIAGLFGFIYEFIFYFFNSGMKTFYYRGANFFPWINIYATGSEVSAGILLTIVASESSMGSSQPQNIRS